VFPAAVFWLIRAHLASQQREAQADHLGKVVRFFQLLAAEKSAFLMLKQGLERMHGAFLIL
jgi:hypothetical protein